MMQYSYDDDTYPPGCEPEPVMEEEAEEEVLPQKKSNVLPVWGNEKTMNLNPLILTNIQSSQYFKVKLYALKTYHEVLDEIYNQVGHLEPWEKGSRKTSGQTGMCGGVRGVGAGGIVSTAYCILYKLFTLRLTRKQVNGCINHTDSPYIRGLGFMYIRYTQPPADLWSWMEPYLDDEEELDVRAGGGQNISIGAMVRHLLTKLDWHSTLFPRIPVPIQKDIEKKISARDAAAAEEAMKERMAERDTAREERSLTNSRRRSPTSSASNGHAKDTRGRASRDREADRRREASPHRAKTSRDRARGSPRDRNCKRSRDRSGSRERDRRRRSRSYERRDNDRHRRDRSRERERDRHRERYSSKCDSRRHRSRSRDRRYR